MKRYPGLSSFDAEQKNVFFGRSKDIEKLCKLIFVERKVLLYSKSGYGKTSLINAGIIPGLGNYKGFDHIRVRFYSSSKNRMTEEESSPVVSSPLQTFIQSIKKHEDFNETEKRRIFLDDYRSDPRNEAWILFKKNQLCGRKEKTYLLIFDQFEELFDYPEDQIIEFKNQLADILYPDRLPDSIKDIEKSYFEDKIDRNEMLEVYKPVNIKVLFSIRSDKLHELNRLADQIYDIQSVFYYLDPLTIEEARTAIKGPACKPGEFDSPPFSFQDEAVKKIIEELTKGDQKIETTQLQIVCQRIEDQIITRYRKNPGEKAGIEIHADDLPDFKDIYISFYHDTISKVKTDDHNKIHVFVEEILINKNKKTRNTVDENICVQYVTQETLKTLAKEDSHLIRAEKNSLGGISYELIHDTLIPAIIEMAEKRRQEEDLRVANKKAEEEKMKREQEAKRQGELLVLQQEKASAAESAARLAEENCKNQRIAARKQRKLLWLTGLVAAIALLAAVFGFSEQNKAKTEEEKAINNLSKFLSTNADNLYNKEEFVLAQKQYNSLLKYTKNKDSIQAQIKSCTYYDSLKLLFYPEYSLADSLLNSPSLDNLIASNSLLGSLEMLDYKPASAKLEVLKTEYKEKLDLTHKQTKELARNYMKVPDKLLNPEVYILLNKLLKAGIKDDPEIYDWLRQVQ